MSTIHTIKTQQQKLFGGICHLEDHIVWNLSNLVLICNPHNAFIESLKVTTHHTVNTSHFLQNYILHFVYKYFEKFTQINKFMD